MAAKQIIYSTEAIQELQDAYVYYEDRKAGLGVKFLRAFDDEVQSIANHPESRQIVKDDLRKGVIRKFGYVLIYEYIKKVDSIYIFAIIHASRNTEYY